MLARRVPVNAAALLVGRVLSAVVSLVVVSIAAHRLDIASFGLMASTMAAGFLVNTLVTFGTDTVVTRSVAAEDHHAAAMSRASLRIQLVAAVVFIGVALVARSRGVDVVVLVQALALVPLALVTVAGAVLRGRQRMDLLLVSTVAGAIVALVSLFVGFAASTSAWVPIAALAAGSTVNGLSAGWFARSTLLASVGRLPIANLLRETAPFAAMVVLAAVGAQVGLLLVEFGTDETTGGYAAAIRLSEAARLVPAAAMGAFFPAMLAGLHRTARYRRWLVWLGGYAVAATLGLLALASPINRIVFDTQPGGATLIRILALGLVLTVARLAMSFELIAEHRERIVLYSALVGAVITVVAGIGFAGRFGAQGVAWSQLAGLASAVGLLALNRSKSTEAFASPLV